MDKDYQSERLILRTKQIEPLAFAATVSDIDIGEIFCSHRLTKLERCLRPPGRKISRALDMGAVGVSVVPILDFRIHRLSSSIMLLD